MTSEDWSHQIVLAPEPVSAGLAREFVCLHLLAHRLELLVEDIRIVVSELATNAVNHARTPFVVTLSMTDGTVVLALQDESMTVPVRSAATVMDVSGRGLLIVELLSHEWGITTDGDGFKTVWACFPQKRGRAVPVGGGGNARRAVKPGAISGKRLRG